MTITSSRKHKMIMDGPNKVKSRADVKWTWKKGGIKNHETFIYQCINEFCSMIDRLTDQVSFIIDALL